MAELGLAAVIVAFVDIGGKVISRLKQYHDTVDDIIPQAFRSVTTQLALTLDTLKRTLIPAKLGKLSRATTTALIPLVEVCLEQVKYLDDRLDKLLPTKDDTP